VPDVPVAATTTAVTTARPMAAPNWNDMVRIPLASPCSRSSTPSVAAIVSGP
jgi:hypothetical protein